MRDVLKLLETNAGTIIRWTILFLLASALLYADARYLSKDESEKRDAQFLQLRKEDLDAANVRFLKIEQQIAIDRETIVRIDKSLSRIEAQTELILKHIQGQQSSGQHK